MPDRRRGPIKRASDYDAWFDSRWGAYSFRLESRVVASLIEPRPGMRVLDVGCGTGPFAAELAAAGAAVTCLDRTRTVLQVARARLGRPLLQADAHALPTEITCSTSRSR